EAGEDRRQGRQEVGQEGKGQDQVNQVKDKGGQGQEAEQRLGRESSGAQGFESADRRAERPDQKASGNRQGRERLNPLQRTTGRFALLVSKSAASFFVSDRDDPAT